MIITPQSSGPRFPRAFRVVTLTLTLTLTLAAAALRGQIPNAPADSAPGNPATFLPAFQPLRTEAAALSPDGQNVAYSYRHNDEIWVALVDRAKPNASPVLRAVLNDRDAAVTEVMGIDSVPAHIRWLGWTESNRLVVESNRSVSHFLGRSRMVLSDPTGVIEALDADGTHGAILASPDRLAELRTWGYPRVFDFAAGTPDSIVVRSSFERGWTLARINARTGSVVQGPPDLPQIDVPSHFVLDRAGTDRIFVPYYRANFPRSYVYDPAPLSRARTLNSIAGVAGQTGFANAPDGFFGPRAVPLGFGDDPSLIYYASNLGRDTFGVFALDARTGHSSDLGLTDPQYDLYQPHLQSSALDPDRHTREHYYDQADRLRNSDSPLVFDRFTRALAGMRYQGAASTAKWLDSSLAAAQSELERALPGKDVDILSWDRAHSHFLVSLQGPDDPGGFYLFDPAAEKLNLIARRTAFSPSSKTSRTSIITAADAAGRPVRGQLTMPEMARGSRAAVILLVSDLPWQRAKTSYQPQVAALTAMGFAVAQIDGPGVNGYGMRRLGPVDGQYFSNRLGAIRSWLQAAQNRGDIDGSRVAAMGSGDGGAFALRLVQECPDQFRAGVALDPVIDDPREKALSNLDAEEIENALNHAVLDVGQGLLTDRPERIRRPVFLLAYPGRDGDPRRHIYRNARDLASAIRHRQGTAEFAALDQGYPEGAASAQAKAFAQIQVFLNRAFSGGDELNAGSRYVAALAMR